MIMGDRGTGKLYYPRPSRSAAEIEVVADDPFNSHPSDPELMSDFVKERFEQSSDSPLPVSRKKVTMVDLPLGATEDRVCGTIDIEKPPLKGLRLLNLDF